MHAASALVIFYRNLHRPEPSSNRDESNLHGISILHPYNHEIMRHIYSGWAQTHTNASDTTHRSQCQGGSRSSTGGVAGRRCGSGRHRGRRGVGRRPAGVHRLADQRLEGGGQSDLGNGAGRCGGAGRIRCSVSTVCKGSVVAVTSALLRESVQYTLVLAYQIRG